MLPKSIRVASQMVGQTAFGLAAILLVLMARVVA
jgi:hypothetical protein